MIKVLKRLGTHKTYFNFFKCDLSQAYSISLNGDKPNAFLLNAKIGQGCQCTLYLFTIVLEDLAKTIDN